MDGSTRRETILVPLLIFASIAGNIFFQALFLAFPLTCRQWAILFVVSGVLFAAILVAIVVVLVPRPHRKPGGGE